MGQFQKGEGGRPKGSPNKNTNELREWINGFLHENKGMIHQDFMSLEPKDRIMMFEKLLKYALPVLQAVQIESEFDSLTDAQLEHIIDQLKRSSNELDQ